MDHHARVVMLFMDSGNTCNPTYHIGNDWRR